MLGRAQACVRKPRAVAHLIPEPLHVNNPVITPAQVRPRARSGPVLGPRRRPRPHRVQVHIPRAGLEVGRVIGVEANRPCHRYSRQPWRRLTRREWRRSAAARVGVQVDWSLRALTDLAAIQGHIHPFRPLAAQRRAQRLKRAGDSLAEHPERGRPAGGLRNLATAPPCLIRYRVKADAVQIVRMRHGARPGSWIERRVAFQSGARQDCTLWGGCRRNPGVHSKGAEWNLQVVRVPIFPKGSLHVLPCHFKRYNIRFQIHNHDSSSTMRK